jgi:hypothetical protein
MKNRFSNRETLNFQQVGGFDPTGGSGGVKPSRNVTSSRATDISDISGISALDAIKNALNIKFEPGTAATIAAGEFAQASA